MTTLGQGNPKNKQKNLCVTNNDVKIAETLNSKIPVQSPGIIRSSFSQRLRKDKVKLNNNSNRTLNLENSKEIDKKEPNNLFKKISSAQAYKDSESEISVTGISGSSELNSNKQLTVITAEKNYLSNKNPHNGDSKIHSENQINNSFEKVNGIKENGSITSGNCESRVMALNLNGSVGPTVNSISKLRPTKYPYASKANGSVNNNILKSPVTPDSPNIYIDDDIDSIYSYSSIASGRPTMSCEHPFVARNGTTFSGRKMKYVVHCPTYSGQIGEDYLTPTQRAQRQLRILKELLAKARHDLEEKDIEIIRLTREVVELRLFKASLSSPEDRSNSSDAITVREAITELKTSQDVSPIVDISDDGSIKLSPRHILHNQGNHSVQLLDKISNSEMHSSFADSGHFEDMTTSSFNSKESYIQTAGDDTCESSSYKEQRQELIKMYEKRIEDLIKDQDTKTSDIKSANNDKIEALLQKLAECNTRYGDMVPNYEQAKERIRELEKQLEDLQQKLQEQEDKQKKMYLHMYTKGQEAEKLAHTEQVLEFAYRAPNRVSVPELLYQLQSTQNELENIRAMNNKSQSGSSQELLTAKEAISLWVLGARKTIYRRIIEAQQNKTKVDPEITLQFLKSAIYYFLTDKENSQGHLSAIESILNFSEQEKYNINKARSTK